jgi:hypothetical protein
MSIGRKKLSIPRMLTISNFIYRFNAISFKNPIKLFVDINKLILEYIWEGKRPRIANTLQQSQLIDTTGLKDLL